MATVRVRTWRRQGTSASHTQPAPRCSAAVPPCGAVEEPLKDGTPIDANGRTRLRTQIGEIEFGELVEEDPSVVEF